MKMKRILTLAAAILTVLSLAACGQSESGGQESSQTSGVNAGSKSAADESAASESQPESQESSADSEESEPESALVKSDGYEKFSQLKIGMTEDEVNGILGEPARVDKAYYYYNIMVNGQELEIEVWIDMTTGQVTYINGDFYKDGYRAEFMDDATDLSQAEGLDNGELDTYEACASAFKTPGYLIGIDDDDVKRYLWVDSNDGHMCVTFRADGTVKSYTGYC